MTIEMLKKRIVVLEGREPGTKIVEKIVYRDRADSEVKNEVSDHEDIEESF